MHMNQCWFICSSDYNQNIYLSLQAFKYKTSKDVQIVLNIWNISISVHKQVWIYGGFWITNKLSPSSGKLQLVSIYVEIDYINIYKIVLFIYVDVYLF